MNNIVTIKGEPVIEIYESFNGSYWYVTEEAWQQDSLIGGKVYNGLSKCGYKHDRVVLSDTGDPAHVSMPGVHRVAALVKRWLLSTHQGAVSPKHLEYYLDEYTFRFNRRTSSYRGKLFCRLLQNAVAIGPTRYHDMIKGVRCRSRQPHNV